MPRYAPLPSVNIDPRNEAELVQAASQRVYDASNQTLNDFSSSNPLAALLEGQAFAQGEFLYWANQLPTAVLTEWIGPFLGAQRRLGTAASALLTVTLSPANVPTFVPSGSAFTTNPNLTGGVVYTFVTSGDVTIPAGETVSTFTVYSQYVGTQYNVPANSITTSAAVGVNFTSITNLQPAVGGSDVETYEQVVARFFPLIRAKNPVSAEDWSDFFTNLYGEGTVTSVQPNRSSQRAYNYVADYQRPNGQVSFFVLGPNGVELTKDQLDRGQTAVNFSLPVENQGHLYPITLSQVQFDLTVEVEANGIYGSDFNATSLDFRDRLFSILQPGNVFPATIDPTVSDVDSAFYSTFDVNQRYVNPRVVASAAYNTPPGFDVAAATYTTVYTFTPGEGIYQINDLVYTTEPIPVFYPVLQAFTPTSSDKRKNTIPGQNNIANLILKQIQLLTAGVSYSQGDVVYWGSGRNNDQELHVINQNLTLITLDEVEAQIALGTISPAKIFEPWIVGNSYVKTVGGLFDPDLIEYDYTSEEYIPDPASIIPLSKRPGAFVWQANQNFILSPSTDDLTGAATAGNLGAALTSTELQELSTGVTYSANTWVYTPQIGSGPNPVADPYYNYVDPTQGVVNKYAKVVQSFTYILTEGETVSEFFDSLVAAGILLEITATNADAGLQLFKYKPRFPMGKYLEYRSSVDTLANYYIATQYFTPTSTDINTLLAQGLVYPLYLEGGRLDFLENLNQRYGGQVLATSVDSPGNGYINGRYQDIPVVGGTGFGLRVNIAVVAGQVTECSVYSGGTGYTTGDTFTIDPIYIGEGVEFLGRVDSTTPANPTPLQQPTRMFTFFKGDITYFRQGSQILTYIANTSVTPLFNPDVYIQNGIFTQIAIDPNFIFGALTGDYETNYIPFYNPLYSIYAEDTVISADGRNFYRVMRPFTPVPSAVNWTGQAVTNTARIEEYEGNLLRYVDQYVCEEKILPQLGSDISAIKLGVGSITIIPKNELSTTTPTQQTYVWENTSTETEVPQLSWYTGTAYPYNPPNYGEGTLRL